MDSEAYKKLVEKIADFVAEAFLLHDVVRYVELETGRLLGEDTS